MSEVSDKTREQILAERQEKKKRKAALKNQVKEKGDLSLNKTNSAALENLKTGKSKSQKQSQDDIDIKETSKEVEKNDKSTTKKETCADENKKESSFDEMKKLKKDSNKDSLEKVGGESKCISNDASGKTKSQLKAERRAKQEADRARKLEKNAVEQKKSLDKKVCESPLKKPDTVERPKKTTAEITHKVKLFAHLYNLEPPSDTVDSKENIHPSILQLESQYLTRVISGADASCLALLNALKKVIMDYETPKNQEFSRGLESEISKCLNFLSKSKPLAVSMTNAAKHLKYKINQTTGDEVKCKESICDWISIYIREQLEMAATAIYLFVKKKISAGDVILTYGCCSLIQKILISAYKEGIKFRVIVADGRPWLEGREMLKKLVTAGISCTYVFVNGLSFIMPEVTKILLGAHALLANGYVMSQVGSSQIALLAKTYNVPVLVCCETHKFTERVQTDSFVYNELGNPDDLTSDRGCLSKELLKWKTIPYLTPLNLMYDVTPPDLVSAVVTELAVLPCTSVPVILRIKPPELSY